MKKQIKRVSIMQTSKVVALSYPVLGLIYTAIGIWVIPSSEETNLIRILLICMPNNNRSLWGYFYSHWLFSL